MIVKPASSITPEASITCAGLAPALSTVAIASAIAFQRAEVERQQRLLAQEQVACGRVRAKARALDNAVRRIGSDEMRKQDRFEQSQLDERAQRTSSRWDVAANDGNED